MTADVSGVLGVPEQQPPQEVGTTGGAGSATGKLPANATMADLERVAKPLADAIKFALANNICSASRRSQQRIHEERLKSDQRNKG